MEVSEMTQASLLILRLVFCVCFIFFFATFNQNTIQVYYGNIYSLNFSHASRPGVMMYIYNDVYIRTKLCNPKQ